MSLICTTLHLLSVGARKSREKHEERQTRRQTALFSSAEARKWRGDAGVKHHQYNARALASFCIAMMYLMSNHELHCTRILQSKDQVKIL